MFPFVSPAQNRFLLLVYYLHLKASQFPGMHWGSHLGTMLWYLDGASLDTFMEVALLTEIFLLYHRY